MNRQEERLLTKVAWLYYRENLTQKEIGYKLGYPRIKIMRMLKKAREKGLIKIDISGDLSLCFETEKLLVEKFKLKNTIVVPTSKKHNTRISIAKATAYYLQQKLNVDDILGAAWGKTVYEVGNQMEPSQDMKIPIVMLSGGGVSNNESEGILYNTASKVAMKLGGTCHIIFCPAFVNSGKTRVLLYKEKNIKKVIELGKKATKALVGIGDTTSKSTLLNGNLLDCSDLASLRKNGAVGDIIGRHFDINGKPIELKYGKKPVGLSLKDLKKTPQIIGVAGGLRKKRAILGALNGGYLDVLIIDENTANSVIELYEKSSSPK